MAVAGHSGCATNPVTGKSEIAFTSEAEEIRMGQENYLPGRQQEGGDYALAPALTNYVNGVGQKLAVVADRKLPYEFVVLNNSVPNAWALPGGKIAVNRGLLTELNSEAELAAVLGHEIVHAAARHGAKNQDQGLLLTLGALTAAIALQETFVRLAKGESPGWLACSPAIRPRKSAWTPSARPPSPCRPAANSGSSATNA